MILSFVMIFATLAVGEGNKAHAATTYYKYSLSPYVSSETVDGSCLSTYALQNPNSQYCTVYSYTDFVDASVSDQLYNFRKQLGQPQSPSIYYYSHSYYANVGPVWTPVVTYRKKVFNVYVDEYDTATNKLLGRTTIPGGYTLIHLPSVQWYS